jgi:hypothetical protein
MSSYFIKQKEYLNLFELFFEHGDKLFLGGGDFFCRLLLLLGDGGFLGGLGHVVIDGGLFVCLDNNNKYNSLL